MTKSELVQAIGQKMPHLSGRDADVVVNAIFDAMTEALCIGDRIEVRGFGSFSVRSRRPRVGRNPKTGESIEVPSKRVPFFTVGHDLRERVNEGRLSNPTTGDPVAAEEEEGEQLTAADGTA